MGFRAREFGADGIVGGSIMLHLWISIRGRFQLFIFFSFFALFGICFSFFLFLSRIFPQRLPTFPPLLFQYSETRYQSVVNVLHLTP